MLGNAIRLALRELRRNAMRSFLTILGIVIGVAAVIVMVTLGSGATAQVRKQIASLGSNLLIVRPGQRLGPGQTSGAAPFEVEDAEAIAREVRGLKAVAAVATRNMTAVYGNQNWTTQVVGSTGEYFVARAWRTARGRVFNASEERAGAAVCVLGATVVEKLFGGQDPLGSRVRVQKIPCEVIGVLDFKGQTTLGTDQDDIVVLPLRTFQRRIAGNQDVNMIQVSAQDGVPTEKVQGDIERLLRARRHIRPGEDNDFYVLDVKEITKTLTGTTRILTALLGAVAAVSLLVGGIGIMNIMLVSVTERTREIGIRMAIGARERDVLLQFLVEAIVLSSVGGVIGIGLALAASAALAHALAVPFILRPDIVMVAFLFSAAVGIVFGFFPARKAARLDPIEALRHE